MYKAATYPLVFLMVFQAHLLSANQWINISTPEIINEMEWIDGILFLGTNGGLVEYDPATNKHQHYFRTEGLPSLIIEDISEDKDGNLWIGTYDNGVAVKNNGQWQTVYNPFSQTPSTLLTYCLEIDEMGTVWTGTSHGIYKYENNTWTLTTSFPAWDMKQTSDGKIWAASAKPVLIQNGIAIEDTSCPIFAYADATIAIDTSNRLFFSAPGFGIGMFDGTSWQVFDHTNSILSANSITDMLTTPDGKVLAIAPDTAVYSFDGNSWKEEFIGNDINTFNSLGNQLNVDPNGNIFLGTKNSLTIYDGVNFSTIDLKYKGLSSNYHELTRDQNGDIIVISSNEVLRYNSETLMHQPINLTSPEFDQLNMLIMFNDPLTQEVVFLNPELGVISKNDVLTNIYNPDSVPFNPSYIRSFIKDSQGEYWIGTLNGLYKTDGLVYQFFDNNNSPFTDPSFWALGEDNNGKIWASTPEGIGKWDGSQWSEYFAGIDYGHMFSAAGFDFHFDDNNHLWFGGWGTGLVHFDGTNWEAFTTVNSNIPGHIVYDIESNGTEMLVATSEGVGVFDGTDFIDSFLTSNSAILDDRSRTLRYDSKGNLWISHQGSGISVYNKEGVVLSSSNGNVNDQKFSLKLYPNPTSNFLITQADHKKARINIYSLDGKLLISTVKPDGNNTHSISTEILTNGHYILEYLSEFHSASVRFTIIN